MKIYIITIFAGFYTSKIDNMVEIYNLFTIYFIE